MKSLPKSKRTATNIEGMNPEKGPSFGADIYDGENEPLTEMQKQHNKNKKKNQ
ncbi:small acid-soluble spore protein O [Pseudogracilibacillus auburnensis]|uniref:small acid-soluble spore protein O n=1 Tax=Pseudogracilibacillus auburnensis TaxID=1494959 RepID=UPI0027DA2630|nr:small acid-soluble spore protein O [Pseudogracilibacillus auburnensis]